MMRVDYRDQLAGLNVFGQPTTSEHPRRIALLSFSLAAIAAIALVSGCYLLFSYERPLEPDSKVIAATKIANPGVTIENLRASQQKTATELEMMTQDVAANKADLQKLSDQVSALAAKVDALRDAAAAWPTSSVTRQPNAPAQVSTKKSSKATWAAR
jgi:hypothetical protein